MSEVTDLVVIEKQNAMAVFTTKEQLDPIIEAIEKEARSLVPDVSTRKGRDAIASMAHKVARSKTYIDNAGKDLVAELKALPKQIDESRRIVRERLEALKDEVRRPLTEWEAEQERIKAEQAMNAMHAEALVMNENIDLQRAIQFEADHEMALLMNKDFDREREEQRRGTTSEVHSEKLENIMVHQHYGTQTVNRGAVQPGMLVKHKDSTWTASANARGRLYLHRGVEMTYTKDLLVEVYLNGLGHGLSH